ncbi:hypothetical protein, partial [Staphylococcus gallinarum]|uniref:hypothetical protein n=1 Tax=Staphylococcus gallinarum TaxID=1293 RepID=UPI00317A8200
TSSGQARPGRVEGCDTSKDCIGNSPPRAALESAEIKMNLKYSAAFSFAVLVFCSLVSSKLDIGTGFLMIVSFAALNGWFFIYNLCR